MPRDQGGLITQRQRGVDDPGTHDVGQVGLKSQWWKTKELWWNAQLWLKTIQGWKTQWLKTKNRGQPPIYVGSLAIF